MKLVKNNANVAAQAGLALLQAVPQVVDSVSSVFVAREHRFAMEEDCKTRTEEARYAYEGKKAQALRDIHMMSEIRQIHEKIKTPEAELELAKAIRALIENNR